jgi:hypothetical protein
MRARVLALASLALAVFALAFAPALAHADDTAPPALPANLKVPAPLKPILEDVLRHSPTFRREVDLLRRAPHVRIVVSFGDLSTWHSLRAESRIYRYEFGALYVDMRLYTLREAIEMIAHEMEHVCEAIEGTNVRALADRRNSGVSDTGGHYETRRAVLAGRQVAEEASGVSVDGLIARRNN